jgi:hypothetical protein
MDFKKPRIALYYNVLPQTGYRNDGANLFLFYNYKKLLDGMDAYADPNLMKNDTGNIVALSPVDPFSHFGSFDLNGLVDYGEDGLGIPLDWEIPHPNFYWIADSHRGYEYRLNRAKQFDTIFMSHKPSIEKFIKDGIPAEKIHYMPWAAEPMAYKPFSIMEKYNWCFIGHLTHYDRIALCDRFCKEWPLGEKGYLGWRQGEFPGHNVFEDAARKYSQSKIVLNESIMDDVNMRDFEVLACKRLLLREDIPGIHDHFEDGKHLVLFKSIDEAVEKAKYYLEHEDERNVIAEAGYREFLDKHTYMHRAKEILKICLDYELPPVSV